MAGTIIIIAIFWFLDRENIDIDTIINFRPILFAEIWHIEYSCQPFWKWLPQPPQTIIIAIFWFFNPENTDIDTIINFLSILFADIWDIENSCQPFWKWLPQPQQTNIIAIFGFFDPEKTDIDTLINFLSILFAEIWGIENSCRPIWKWMSQPHIPNLVGVPSWHTFSWDMVAVYQGSCLYHTMHDFSLSIRTIYFTLLHCPVKSRPTSVDYHEHLPPHISISCWTA